MAKWTCVKQIFAYHAKEWTKTNGNVAKESLHIMSKAQIWPNGHVSNEIFAYNAKE